MKNYFNNNRILKLIIKFSWIFTIFFFIGCTEHIAPDESIYPIIPSPQNISYGKKEIVFNTVSINAKDFAEEGLKLQKFLNDNGIEQADDGLKIEIIRVEILETKNKEAYQLKIDEKVTLLAETSAGAFYGIQTLRQLFRVKRNFH